MEDRPDIEVARSVEDPHLGTLRGGGTLSGLELQEPGRGLRRRPGRFVQLSIHHDGGRSLGGDGTLLLGGKLSTEREQDEGDRHGRTHRPPYVEREPRHDDPDRGG